MVPKKNEIELLKLELERERTSRLEAERILKEKSTELNKLNSALEEVVKERIREIRQLARFPEENPSPVIRTDQNGKILYRNRASKLMLKSFSNEQKNYCPQPLIKVIKRCLDDGKSFEFEFKSGDRIYALILTPIQEYNYVNIYGFDITINKRAEKEIKTSQLKYKDLFENIYDAIVILDEKGFISEYNVAAKRLLEYSEEELVGLHVNSIVHKEDREQSKSYFKKLLKEGQYSNYQGRIITKSGKEKFVEVNSNSIIKDGIFKGSRDIIRDVSDRKKSETLLTRSEEKYRRIIENINGGILESDVNGKITYIYDGFINLTGFAKEDILGKSELDLLADPSGTEIMQIQHEQRKEGKTGVYEIQIKRKDGSKIWVLVSGAPIYDDQGIITGSIGIYLDISLRKKAEEELITAKEVAEHSVKIKEIFLANMSHEIRTPMNAILGMGKLLIDTTIDNKQKKYLNAINTSANNLLVIINDILDFTKIESGKLKLETVGFNLDELVSSILDTVSYKVVEKDVFLSKKVDPLLKDIVLLSDPVRINQVLINLANNAIKFTSKGEVTINANIIENNEDTSIVHFSVNDTGIGIPEDKLEKIFDSFSQADTSTTRKYGGTGLGLSICKKLVEMLGGKLEVKSVLDKGTTFHFTLKFKKGDSTQLLSSDEEEDVTGIKLHDKYILLVEDHKFNQFYAATILEERGAKVDIAENGKIALEKVQKNTYDLILMDMQMPVMGGLEATRIIRKKYNTPIPIIALTANAVKGDSEKCLEAGMNDYISKPFKPEILVQKIKKYLLVSDEKIKIMKPLKNEDKNNQKNTEEILFDLKLLKEIAAGNRDFMKKMIDIFIEETPDSLLDLLENCKATNWERVKSIAHKLKPSIEYLGIKGMYKVVVEIEALAVQRDNKNKEEVISKTEYLTKVIDDSIRQLKEKKENFVDAA